MSTPEEERREIETAIAALEAQRGVLGDVVVDLAVAPLRMRLEALRGDGGPEARLAGEFKNVTVMFADLSGFTALA